MIQPHAVALYPTPPEGSPRNVWAATVADIDRQADRVRVRLDGDVPLVAEITPAALDALALRPGDPSGPPSRPPRSPPTPPSDASRPIWARSVSNGVLGAEILEIENLRAQIAV